MSHRSTPPPRLPAGPPADVETGTAALHGVSLRLFQRTDGDALDCLLITCLFKLGFDLLDKLPEDRRTKLADRVHQRAYAYLASDAGAENVDPLADSRTAPARTSDLKSPSPRPPRL